MYNMERKRRKMNKKAIGIFDSGLGGTTVLKELINSLPNEDYIYYDNERDCLVHYSLQFEGCEAYQTKDYFIAWANFLKGLTEDGYLPYWHK